MRTAAIKHFYAVAGFNGVQHITVLGVTLSRNFSMAKHIDTVMSSCARTLYGLRTLRAHGMPQAALQLVFSARQHAERAICYRPSVRLSVRLSHGWISQKRLKLGSCNFHRTVAQSL